MIEPNNEIMALANYNNRKEENQRNAVWHVFRLERLSARQRRVSIIIMAKRRAIKSFHIQALSRRGKQFYSIRFRATAAAAAATQKLRFSFGRHSRQSGLSFVTISSRCFWHRLRGKGPASHEQWARSLDSVPVRSERTVSTHSEWRRFGRGPNWLWPIVSLPKKWKYFFSAQNPNKPGKLGPIGRESEIGWARIWPFLGTDCESEIHFIHNIAICAEKLDNAIRPSTVCSSSLRFNRSTRHIYAKFYGLILFTIFLLAMPA